MPDQTSRPAEIVTIPCLSDNYAYLIRDGATTSLVDAPEAAPIIAALDARGWALDQILITHHHHDHVGAVDALRAKYGCTVLGPAAEADKMPALDRPLREGDSGDAGDLRFEVIDVPGHTLGHIAYHFPALPALFCADSLMVMGCGRLFEGTPAMMWQSLEKMAALDPATLICSGHEYTQSNMRFALSIDPDNAALALRAQDVDRLRAAGKATVPAPLAQELATNPFLRAGDPALKSALGLEGVEDAEVFAHIRALKDRF